MIYDSDQPGARLIGVEYVIPEEAFVKLPEDEKKVCPQIICELHGRRDHGGDALEQSGRADGQYWHSHKYEVESGMLILGTKQLVPSA